ncbi:MAG: helix-turn-helix domain-containing protein, partial [Acidobacteria bacterium]|nr:helix-turn-helix domain-containing protein [Acidobacteriota bacterium]
MSSAGENLKNEREARGISLREISEHTKISVRFFKAIEEGKMELLPGGIFNKSFVRHYAAYIGLDEQQTVAEYFEEVRREQEAANPQVIASPKEGMLRPTGGNLSLIFAAIVLGVILLVGIAYALYRFSDREDVPLTAMRNGIDFSWESIAEYMDALGRKRGVNAGALIGHSGLRRYVMGEEASDRVETTPEEIEAMKRLTRDGMLAGALGFSTGSGNDSPCGIATDEERFALASVLGELGTGIFQVSGGSTGGVFGPLHLAKELSIRTGRPAIYNLMSQQLNAPPDQWKEHLGLLEEAFKAGARAYGSCLSVTAGPIFNLRQGLDTAQDEDLISPHIMFSGMPTWDS